MHLTQKATIALSLMASSASISLGQSTSSQVVFLDFDSGVGGTVDYSKEDRDVIQDIVEIYFRGFSVEFTQTLPPSGEFSRIVYNMGNTVADDSDFRNLNKSDGATVNFSSVNASEEDLILLTANATAHELGHLMGGLHDDPYGPIGFGVPPDEQGLFLPVYPGPTLATRDRHIMDNRNPLIYGLQPAWFTARTAVKLMLGEVDVAVDETKKDNDTVDQAQLLRLQNLRVPNNSFAGEFAGSGDFSFSAAVAVGSLNSINGDFSDFYEFEATAGDLINMEAISGSTDRYDVTGLRLNSDLTVLDPNGVPIPYYGTTAFNDFRPFLQDLISEPRFVDLVIPSDGKHIVRVEGGDAVSLGVYELFIHRFNGILGDANHDGTLDLLDVEPFVDAIVAQEYEPKLDINLDGQLDLLDVQPFVDLLSGN